MNSLGTEFFDWLLLVSAQAAIITLLILLVQTVLRPWLHARWRQLLWLLVIARLAMPISFSSPTSLFNLVPAHLLADAHPALPQPVAPTPARPPTARPSESLPSQSGAPNATPYLSDAPTPAGGWQPDGRVILALIWAAGASVLTLRLVAKDLRFRRRVAQGCLVTEQRALALFQDCKTLMRVPASVELIETDAVKGPGLHGLVRLRLLLPVGLIHSFDDAELKHVFLHELGHVRRRDPFGQGFAAILEIIHWFNPVLWLAFRRMEVDRELACDDLVLSVTGEGNSRAYGRTIVKLVEAYSEPLMISPFLGFLGRKGETFQRISMISRFKPHSPQTAAGLVVLSLLAVITLTGAKSQTTSKDELPALETAYFDHFPWARVEGTARLNHHPAAGQALALFVYNSHLGRPDFSLFTNADENGHFIFPRVLPGDCTLGYSISRGHGVTSHTSQVAFKLAPGQSTNITGGGDGDGGPHIGDERSGRC